MKHLETVDVKEGTSFKLDCTVKGTPPFTAQWFKDGEPLDQGYEYTMTFEDNVAAMHANESFAEDSGTYMCRVFNEVGSDSSSAKVTVAGEPLGM